MVKTIKLLSLITSIGLALQMNSLENKQNMYINQTAGEINTGYAETAAAETTAKIPESEPAKTYNGITEGDIVIGELTYYCVCQVCCNNTNGITASGIIIQNGVYPEMPVASCNWLPFGTILEIENVNYIVADRGGRSLDAVGRLDIFTPEGHNKALELGRKRNIEIRVVSLP